MAGAAAEAAAAARRRHRAEEGDRAADAAAAAARAAAEAQQSFAAARGGPVRPSWEAQERGWELFAAQQMLPSAPLVRLRDVPWPDFDALAEDGSTASDPKPHQLPGAGGPPRGVLLRALQTRWHPDRFAQRFGARLAPEEREEILRRVTEVAARVNSLKEG